MDPEQRERESQETADNKFIELRDEEREQRDERAEELDKLFSRDDERGDDESDDSQ
jgi:hypothetical protein